MERKALAAVKAVHGEVSSQTKSVLIGPHVVVSNNSRWCTEGPDPSPRADNTDKTQPQLDDRSAGCSPRKIVRSSVTCYKCEEK